MIIGERRKERKKKSDFLRIKTKMSLKIQVSNLSKKEYT